MPADSIWERSAEHRSAATKETDSARDGILSKIDARLQRIAWELPQRQSQKRPVQLTFSLCNPQTPCTHCPHPRWLRWVPNPRRPGKFLPSRVDNPGRVLRGEPSALALYREAEGLLRLRTDILTLQTQLRRKVLGQLNSGVLFAASRDLPTTSAPGRGESR
jgi:hypothetical protein